MKRKQKIKAELWDKMQYLFRNYYDRMVHAVLYYDGLIDIPTLKTVLIATINVYLGYSSLDRGSLNMAKPKLYFTIQCSIFRLR